MRAKRFLLWGIVLCTFTIINLYLYLNANQNKEITRNFSLTQEEKITIYFITPTYWRHVQKAELIRISHTLLLVHNVHWILVEDAPNKTKLVTNLLRETSLRQNYGFKYTHLNEPTPMHFKTKDTDPNWLKPRGVWQRNKALEWLREHSNSINTNGVVYFGDDDNTYDLKLFDEIRSTTKVSVFPVALVGGLLVEKPIVVSEKVTGFNSVWQPNRKYPVDMAGFAINLNLILEKKNVLFSENVARGYQETHLLKQLVDSYDQLEPKATSCRKILVWHTRTQLPKLRQEKKLKIPSNYNMLDD